LGIADQTGRLAEGFTADIAVLANDQLTVRKTFVEGICVYEQN
jgi:imidazolonepropionase-like amidohydrolase